ncbi:glycosyl transferase family 1, partial [candidate division MSBL1 archaeon SCGC-AAA382A20]
PEFREISHKEWLGGYISNRITTVSLTLKNELTWLYNIPEDKIDVVKNGGQIGKYHKEVDPGRTKERYGIHSMAPVVFFIGRLEYQKGPDLLIKAIPEILEHRRDVKFLFAGKGGMRDHLEYLAKDLKVGASFKFLGYLPDEEYLEILNACDIVCIPSRNEPFGLVLFEAWDAEKAVVATSVGGLEENIDNFVNGIKVYPHPESIAWGVKYIINDREGVQELGKRGKEKLERSTWPIVANLYEKVYMKALPEDWNSVEEEKE